MDVLLLAAAGAIESRAFSDDLLSVFIVRLLKRHMNLKGTHVNTTHYNNTTQQNITTLGIEKKTNCKNIYKCCSNTGLSIDRQSLCVN